MLNSDNHLQLKIIARCGFGGQVIQILIKLLGHVWIQCLHIIFGFILRINILYLNFSYGIRMGNGAEN